MAPDDQTTEALQARVNQLTEAVTAALFQAADDGYTFKPRDLADYAVRAVLACEPDEAAREAIIQRIALALAWEQWKREWDDGTYDTPEAVWGATSQRNRDIQLSRARAAYEASRL